jgi:hypothetical protein
MIAFLVTVYAAVLLVLFKFAWSKESMGDFRLR